VTNMTYYNIGVKVTFRLAPALSTQEHTCLKHAVRPKGLATRDASRTGRVPVLPNQCAWANWWARRVWRRVAEAVVLGQLLFCAYLRSCRLGCSQEKMKSAIDGKSVVSSPSRGATPTLAILSQKSAPSSPGFVSVT